MARLNGGVYSKLKGKIAGTVFQQYEGMNVVKEYQPNVKNPQTTAQMESRAKFKASSQFISAFAVPLLLAALELAPYPRYRRGELVKRLYRIAEINRGIAELPELEVLGVLATLNFNPRVHEPVITATSPNDITISGTSGDTAVYTIVAISSTGVVFGTDTKVVTLTDQPTSVPLPRVPGEPAEYRIMATCSRAVTENGSAWLTQLSNLQTVNIERSANAGDIMVSNPTYYTIQA